jgi:hypothetical protein
LNYFLSSEIYVLYPYIYLNSCHNRGNILVYLYYLLRDCFFKYVIVGNIEERIRMTGSRRGRRKQLLYDLKEERRYWKLKEKAPNPNLWGTRFGRGYEHA